MPNQKCPHREPPKMGYMEAYDDAHERMKKKEHQRLCPICRRYIWESFFSQPEAQASVKKYGGCFNCVVGKDSIKIPDKTKDSR